MSEEYIWTGDLEVEIHKYQCSIDVMRIFDPEEGDVRGIIEEPAE